MLFWTRCKFQIRPKEAILYRFCDTAKVYGSSSNYVVELAASWARIFKPCSSALRVKRKHLRKPQHIKVLVCGKCQEAHAFPAVLPTKRAETIGNDYEAIIGRANIPRSSFRFELWVDVVRISFSSARRTSCRMRHSIFTESPIVKARRPRRAVGLAPEHVGAIVIDRERVGNDHRICRSIRRQSVIILADARTDWLALK
jgi:hypothetical protein